MKKSDNLTLPVNNYWEGLIKNGDIDWDYREVKPYWISRICDCVSTTTNIYTIKDSICDFKTATFTNRYTNKSMVYEVKDIFVVNGNDYDIFPNGKYFFIIELGERLK